MKVGLPMRAIRKRHGLTLDDLSALCRVCRDDLGGYERGKLTPRPETVQRIAAALDIPITSVRNGMGWTEPQRTERWELSQDDSLLRDGILETIREDADGDPELLENDVLALMDMVKASVPALVEYMKDSRPEPEIIWEIARELDTMPEEDSEEILLQRFALTDEQWAQIRDLLPSERSGNGRPFKSNRLMLEAILFRMKSGLAWNRLPKHFGRYQCVTERLRLWRRLGVWEPVLQQLFALGVLQEEVLLPDDPDSER